MNDHGREFRDLKSFKLRPITHRIDPYDEFQHAVRRRSAAERPQYIRIAGRNRFQEASPRKVDVDLIRDAVKLFGQILYGGLYEHRIWQAAFRRLPRCLYRRLFERLDVGVHADEELVRVRLGRRRHKSTVARPDVYHDPFAGMGQ